MKLFGNLQKMFNRTPKRRCEKCSSEKMHHSHNWSRGWNAHCQQAYGDSGYRCYDCGHIHWDVSHEEHLKRKPEWCIPHDVIQSKETENA